MDTSSQRTRVHPQDVLDLAESTQLGSIFGTLKIHGPTTMNCKILPKRGEF